jgi:hypothetical protein
MAGRHVGCGGPEERLSAVVRPARITRTVAGGGTLAQALAQRRHTCYSQPVGFGGVVASPIVQAAKGRRIRPPVLQFRPCGLI